MPVLSIIFHPCNNFLLFALSLFYVMKALLITCVCCACFLHSKAQKVFNGYVQDSATGERLVNAYIKVMGESSSSVTNSFGYFTVRSSNDTCVLLISYAGYDNEAIRVTASTELPVNILMVQLTTFKGTVVKGK